MVSIKQPMKTWTGTNSNKNIKLSENSLKLKEHFINEKES